MEDLGFELRKQLIRYLAGGLGISDFHAAVTPLFWNIEKRADQAAADLGREIELLLAETAHGDWTEDELRERLSPMVTNYVVSMGAAPAFSSVNSVTVSQVNLSESGHPEAQTRFFDISPATAS